MGSPVLWPLGGGALAVVALIALAIDLKKRSRGGATAIELSDSIRAGLRAYMLREGRHVWIFVAVLAALLGGLGAWKPASGIGWQSVTSFLLGSICAAGAGCAGLNFAGRAGARALESANAGGIRGGFGTAISGAAPMGLGAVGFALLGLYFINHLFPDSIPVFAAFGLGAAMPAFFARTGGGIYATGADIAADHAGRLAAGIPQDDARNPVAVADCIGDNLGAAAQGGDLGASQAGAIVAATAIAAAVSVEKGGNSALLMGLPLAVAAVGCAACVIGIAYCRVFASSSPRRSLAVGAGIAMLLTMAGAWFAVERFGSGLQNEISGGLAYARRGIFCALATGILAGAVAAATTAHATSARFKPTRRISNGSRTGAAFALIEGLRAGMMSCGLPALALAAALVAGRVCAGTFGISMAALGAALAAGFVIIVSSFGAIADNAAALAEMTHADRAGRELTANLNAAGQSSGAAARSYAACVSYLVSAALVLAYVVTARIGSAELSLGNAKILAGLLVGAAAPQVFGALLLGAVGRSAQTIAAEAGRQIGEIPGILEGKARPDYLRCAQLAARGAARGMMLPAVLAVALPLAAGFLDRLLLAGLVTGAATAGFAAALPMVNAGAAMNSARKCIEEGICGGLNSDANRAAIVADATGDAMKEAVGPGIGALVRVMCSVALLLATLLR